MKRLFVFQLSVSGWDQDCVFGISLLLSTLHVNYPFRVPEQVNTCVERAGKPVTKDCQKVTIKQAVSGETSTWKNGLIVYLKSHNEWLTFDCKTCAIRRIGRRNMWNGIQAWLSIPRLRLSSAVDLACLAISHLVLISEIRRTTMAWWMAHHLFEVAYGGKKLLHNPGSFNAQIGRFCFYSPIGNAKRRRAARTNAPKQLPILR